MVAATALAVAGAAAIWTSPDRAQGAASLSYMQTLRQSWQRVQTATAHPFIWDTQVPPSVVTPVFSPFNRISTTAALLMPLRLDAASGQGYVVNGVGGLVPARVTVVSRAAVGAAPTCLAPSASAHSVSVSLGHAVPVGNWFLRLSYTRSTGFTGNFGGERVQFAQGRGAFVIPDAQPKVYSAVTFIVPAGASACISGADIEAPVAR